MKKILVIGTGGTIASVREDTVRLDDPFKIIEYANCEKAEFECVSPFSVLSENMDLALWQALIEFIRSKSPGDYAGIIVLHGSDTLAYTGAVLANLFYKENICLTASDKPIEDKGANGIKNFLDAVDYILAGNTGVVISYDGIKPAQRTVSADSGDRFITAGREQAPIKSPAFRQKNILVIQPYVGIDYGNYKLEGVDAVLHAMYHSATAPKNVRAFANKCKKQGVPFYFVTAKSRADYESAKDLENIIFNCTLENAYARLLLT